MGLAFLRGLDDVDFEAGLFEDGGEELADLIFVAGGIGGVDADEIDEELGDRGDVGGLGWQEIGQEKNGDDGTHVEPLSWDRL